MFSKIISIFKKTRLHGWQWLYKRLILEFRISETPLGKRLKSCNIVIYRFFSFITFPLHLLTRKTDLMKKTLYVFYDLEVSPITFNLCEALGVANAYRKELGLKYLYVVFVPGPHHGVREEMKDYDRIINKDARQWRKHNLLFPVTALVPNCIGFSNCASRKEAELFRKQISPNIYPKGYSTMFPLAISFYEGARSASSHVMAIKATPQALQYVQQWLTIKAKGRKTIVLTLRHYAYMIERNSNIEAWSKFAHTLDPSHYFIVIVPDTETAMNKPMPELATFEHFTEASWNIELRAALYESAYLNLGINNGPFSLCWLNKNCRYIMFKIITEKAPQTTEEALKKHGFILRQNPPFAMPYQKWVWENDTEEVLTREFNAMCTTLKELATT